MFFGRNEELVSKTFVSCVEASRGKESLQKGNETIAKNTITACEDSSRSLICIPASSGRCFILKFGNSEIFM